jgi:two-component system OmpR family response regulator
MTNPYQSLSVDGLRLLVIDDYPDTREMLTTLFEAEGALIQAVATVDEALNVMSASSPDILISEIYLPDKAENLLLAKLQKLEACLGRWIPAIALTSFAQEKDRTYALKAGFGIYLSKPIDLYKLLGVVCDLKLFNERPHAIMHGAR